MKRPRRPSRFPLFYHFLFNVAFLSGVIAGSLSRTPVLTLVGAIGARLSSMVSGSGQPDATRTASYVCLIYVTSRSVRTVNAALTLLPCSGGKKECDGFTSCRSSDALGAHLAR
jgi:hypothetical protein